MIVNHQHRFIFIRTRKTASTSVEMALRRVCGPSDIITPLTVGSHSIEVEEESVRHILDLPGSQNMQIPLPKTRPGDWRRAMWHRQPRPQFWHHMAASRVRSILGEDVWSGYFTFTIERNPYDRAVSLYYWRKRTAAEHRRFLDVIDVPTLSNWNLYASSGEIDVDFIIRYENLSEDLARVGETVGAALDLPAYRAKSTFRPNGTDYHNLIDEASRSLIEERCANEIDHFGYSW